MSGPKREQFFISLGWGLLFMILVVLAIALIMQLHSLYRGMEENGKEIKTLIQESQEVYRKCVSERDMARYIQEGFDDYLKCIERTSPGGTRKDGPQRHYQCFGAYLEYDLSVAFGPK